MAEDAVASADPSMEEILASIRKIISDDAPAAEAAAPAPPPAAPVPPPAPEPVPEPAPVTVPAPPEEILELTQMVQDDGSVVDLTAPAMSEPTPPPSPPPSLSPAEPLMSAPAATSAASALSSLATTVELDRLSSSPVGTTYLGNGSRTLEDMVVELMRPLLREWLDQNLPPIVERLVQKEIERIARRS